MRDEFIVPTRSGLGRACRATVTAALVVPVRVREPVVVGTLGETRRGRTIHARGVGGRSATRLPMLVGRRSVVLMKKMAGV